MPFSWATTCVQQQPCSVQALLELSRAQRLQQKFGSARQFAEKAVELARQETPQKPLLLAKALTQLGNMRLYNKGYAKAFAAYTEALALLSPNTHNENQANVLINLAQLWVEVNTPDKVPPSQKKQLCPACNTHDINIKATQAFQTALTAALPLTSNPPQADRLLHLAQIGYTLSQNNTSKLLQHVVKTLQTVKNLDSSHFPRQVSYANGLLAQIYFDQQRYEDAHRLLKKALFYAQQASAMELLFRWHRSIAKIYMQRDEIHQAINHYQQATNYLQEIRPQLLTLTYQKNDQQPLRKTELGTVYLEFMDLLLREAEKTTITKMQRQDYLIQTIAVQENFKAKELQEYYQDDCIAEENYQNAITNNCEETSEKHLFQKIAVNEAVLYPIMLSDRLEIVLYQGGTLTLGQTLPIPSINRTIKKLSKKLKNHTSTVQPEAGMLYRWLIEPFTTQLQTVNTLIVIPDGLLRTIPFSALYDTDNNQYLLEKMAIVVTPNLTLVRTDARKPLERLFLNGLSEYVKDYGALTNVNKEISVLQSLSNTHLLLNQNFTYKKFHAEVKRYLASAVHIATHGEFRNKVENSILKTYDGNLKLNDLEILSQQSYLRGEPLQLLSLSACESAVGNERAALGLSGIAVKAGARSALASLWKVSDASTCYLMARFYQLRQQGNRTTAQALRMAQLELLQGNVQKSVCIEDADYEHPYYWAAFILIGSWL